MFFQLLVAAEAQGRTEHQIFFPDTPYELNVYKIIGRKEGPTMMIIGGIQGDEPGGFLSADLYTDLALQRGTLIVVPRANFYSILVHQRGPNGDMNRKFGADVSNDMDSQIVHVLKNLMQSSDILLNLHDGFGFYRPKKESDLANPLRYGQSIISDCEVFTSPRTGTKLELRKIAEKVISKINSQIDDSKYHFHYMNTRTGEPDTPYSEQRLSATFYALTKVGIPAFGVETSKNLPTIEMKVHQHNLAVNAFMELFGLVPEQPRIYLEKPQLDYLVVAVNDRIPVAVPDGESLVVNPGDSIEVVHVESNYDRGLSVDILGLGSINDFRQKYKITRPTFIVAQKDHMKFGRVPLVLASPESPGTPAAVAPAASQVFTVKNFIVEVDGQKKNIRPGDTLEAIDGDILRIIDVETEGTPPAEGIVVNFKGFVGDKANNNGEDRGVFINTATQLLKRYSISKTEKLYVVAVEQGKKSIAEMTVRLGEPRLDYLVMRCNNGPDLRLKNGAVHKIKPGVKVRILDLKTNIPANKGVAIQVGSGTARVVTGPEALPVFEFGAVKTLTLVITREGLTLGKVVLSAG
ncbi:MAG: M14/M99 family metallopeptidase [Pseudomonadota bacterium]